MADPPDDSLVGSHHIYNNVPVSPTPTYPSPICVIPTLVSIRQFTRSESDYTVRQFLDLCEAAIVNSSIIEEHDKIAFIRSLLPGSKALLLMQSSAFATADIGTNYEFFKKNFIKIFGGGNKPSVVRQVARIVLTLQKNA